MLEFCQQHEDCAGGGWTCCGRTFLELRSMKQHAADAHLRPGRTLPDAASIPLVVHRLPQPLPPPSLQPAYHATASARTVVLLFYRYVPVADAADVRLWQEQLCMRLGLQGKVRVAEEGINGTLSGQAAATDAYIATMLLHPLFAGASTDSFKRSVGRAEGNNFVQGLSVQLVKEIVHLGITPERSQPQQGGERLSPGAFHRLADATGRDDVLLVDCRNFYESRIVGNLVKRSPIDSLAAACC